ncbi:MAG: hypothetical protein GXY44_00770 [Phycisphaerales bacterium]|nr:hypothetical protein [Phycisphaerales bacterium]
MALVEKRAKAWRFLFAPIGLLAAVSVAAATPIIQLDFLATPANSTENTGVSGRLTLSFTENAGVDYLTLTIANTTPIAMGSKLTAVGMEMPDELATLPVFAPGGTGAYFTRLNNNVTVSPPWMNAPGGYDLMITSDGSFEGGGPNGAPAAGEEHTVVLSLGSTTKSPEEWAGIFNEFYLQTADYYTIARFQAVGPDAEDSDKVLGTHTPEPATLVFLALTSLVYWKPRMRVR